ncbi:hypothetical protein [Spirilliplanes yamanashiensis]|nr:hypothetical protein [Spirilliplanes yamanashiensis]MDP9818458.1 hypothetical protein [Spirilliplanes yamanashiensis]
MVLDHHDLVSLQALAQRVIGAAEYDYDDPDRTIPAYPRAAAVEAPASSQEQIHDLLTEQLDAAAGEDR